MGVNEHSQNQLDIGENTLRIFAAVTNFYRAKDEANLRHEIQGTVYKAIAFHEWKKIEHLFQSEI